MPKQLILGIEESGRGPVVGPMIIAGALFESSAKKDLKKAGVKDSKLLTKKKRSQLSGFIEKTAKAYKLIEVWPKEIDQRFGIGLNLNELEAVKFAELINELKPTKAIIDCPSPNVKGFENYMLQYITHKCKIVCVNYADRDFIEVGAASIIAKVLRDRRIREIEEKVGFPIGVGYPTDPLTIKFVEKAHKNKEWVRKYIRTSWMTFQNIKTKAEQKSIGEF